MLVTYLSGGYIRIGGMTILVLFTLYAFITDGNVNHETREILLDVTPSETNCDCNKARKIETTFRVGSNSKSNQNMKQTIYHTEGFELYIHSAHYDTRFNDNNIRIFGIENKVGVSKNFTCRSV